MLRALPLVLVLVLSTLIPQRAEACSCMAVSVEDAIANSAAIVEARVVSVDPGEEGSVVVTLAVTQSWRGVETEQMVVRTSESSASCGYSFEVGVTYLVYADGTPDAWTVSLCSRTAVMTDATADREALGAGTIPVEIENEPVEPVRPARTEAPARGGCASCAAGAGPEAPAAAWIALLAGLGILRARRRA
jgi:MYXO-CTERM domain-containing protein